MSSEDPTPGPLPRRDPEEVRREVDARRVKRRLKAAASLLLAATAGTFLACIGRKDKNRPSPAPNPMTEEHANLPAPARPDAAAAPDAGRPDAGPDARALIKAGGQHGKHAPSVDRGEHRKGMPVRDNLLE